MAIFAVGSAVERLADDLDHPLRLAFAIAIEKRMDRDRPSPGRGSRMASDAV